MDLRSIVHQKKEGFGTNGCTKIPSRVCLMSMICSVAVFWQQQNSETICSSLPLWFVFLEYQSNRCLVDKVEASSPKDLPVAKQWFQISNPWLWWWLLPCQVDLACQSGRIFLDITIYRVCPNQKS